MSFLGKFFLFGSQSSLLLDKWINELLIFYCRLSTFGNAGSSHLDYPKDSDLMESFHCNQTQVNRSVLNIEVATDDEGEAKYQISNK